MKKVTLINSTDSVLVVENAKMRYEIRPYTKQSVEYETGDEFRVYKNAERHSKFCISQFFEKETFRNRLFFAPAVAIDLDSFIKPNGQKKIKIAERQYHFYAVAIFLVLSFDEEFADVYDFHEKTDKKKLKLLLSICLLPIFLLSSFAAIALIYGLIYDFSVENIFIYVVCILLMILFAAMRKAFRKAVLVDEQLKNASTNLKRVTSYVDCGRKVKIRDDV